MKSNYDQFFKNARKAAQGGKPQASSPKKFSMKEPSSSRFQTTEAQIEERLKSKAGVPKRRRKKSTPWSLIIFSMIGLAIAGAGMMHSEKLEFILKNIEISFMGGTAMAETPAVTKEAAPAAEAAPAVARQPSSSDLDHLSKLTDRQKELDARAEELARQEMELGKMKEELERRLKELEGMRNQISEILAERVKVDAEKVETLVQMYSNMKPPQAAKIFESLDEDLAVELLSRMKKKSAADIMNLLPAEKAQIFSERYAGYKRK